MDSTHTPYVTHQQGIATQFRQDTYQQQSAQHDVAYQQQLFQQNIVSYQQQPTQQDAAYQQQPAQQDAAYQQQPSIQYLSLQQTPTPTTVFFYQPPNDPCRYHYRVNCMKISREYVENLLNEQNIQSNENECIFYYLQQYNDQYYRVSCEIVSPISVTKCLNENFGSINPLYEEEGHLTFELGQKENLKFYLKQHLGRNLLN